MAFSQPQLDALENAIATGATECSFDGKLVRYRSLDEMMRVREVIMRALGQGAKSRFSLTAFTKDSTTPPPSANYGNFGQNTIG